MKLLKQKSTDSLVQSVRRSQAHARDVQRSFDGKPVPLHEASNIRSGGRKLLAATALAATAAVGVQAGERMIDQQYDTYDHARDDAQNSAPQEPNSVSVEQVSANNYQVDVNQPGE